MQGSEQVIESDKTRRIALSTAIRVRANLVLEANGDGHDAELLKVLARILEGFDVMRAFGSPGDWGYDTPIGKALAGR